MTSEDTLSLLRDIQKNDNDLWAAINLRNNGEDLGEDDEQERSGTNDLHEDCADDDSAIPIAVLAEPDAAARASSGSSRNLELDRVRIVEDEDDGGLMLHGAAEDMQDRDSEMDDSNIEDEDVFVPDANLDAEAEALRMDLEPSLAQRRSKRAKHEPSHYQNNFYHH